MTLPQFSEDSTEQTLANNDPISNSPVKGAIKWDKRDGEYVFLWWQTPFYVATPNGGYSMTQSFLDKLPDHIEKFWVVDDENMKLRRFNRSQYEQASPIHGDDGRFKNVKPESQIAVDMCDARESYDLPSDFTQ